MKLQRPLLSVVALVTLGFLATTSKAGISGSKHDFGGAGWSKGEICLPCHAPHHSNKAGYADKGPLWNHKTLAANTTYAYDTYDSASGEILPSDPIKLDAQSMLCMSCHDGTIALDSFGGVDGSYTIGAKGKLVEGGSLEGNHPVGSAAIMSNDGVMATASYMNNPQDWKTISSTGVATATGMALKKVDGKFAVGCSTCHEPHNRRNQDNMLWVKNNGPLTLGTRADRGGNRSVSGSGLCLTCHLK